MSASTQSQAAYPAPASWLWFRQPQRELPIGTGMALDEIQNAGRHVPQLQIAAAAQFLGDIFGGVLRPAFGDVEGDDATGFLY
jgi:hypothetical protein